MTNLTQHQKDDYLIEIKNMSNQDLYYEFRHLMYESGYYENGYDTEDMKWCLSMVECELLLRLGDWLEK